MDVRKCEAFLQCVETGSFTAAAEKMGYTQSGITRMIYSLEEELGCVLLVRNRFGTQLTKEGAYLMPAIRELCRAKERVVESSAEIRGLHVGELVIGSYFSIAACWLPAVIQKFKLDYPDIHIKMLEATSMKLRSLMEQQALDCCFMSWFDNLPWDWIPLKDDQMVVWLSKDHPLAKENCFPIESLNGAPMILCVPDNDTDADRLLDQWKITPNIIYTTLDANTAYAMVESNIGISLNNELTTKKMKGDVVTLPLTPPCHVKLGIVIPSLKKASPATKKFIDYAKYVIHRL